MQIIHDITMDMARRLPVVPIHAVQGDGSTRLLRLTLLQNGESWPLPQNTTAAVAFRKSDGTRGLYDTLPNGEKAVTFTGNTVTAVLAPQALSCPGAVAASVVFYDANRNALATFPFQIAVARNPAAGTQVSNNYYYLQNMEQVNVAYGKLLTQVKSLYTYIDGQPPVPEDLLEGADWHVGHYYGNGDINKTDNLYNGPMYSDKIPVTPGETYTMTYTAPITYAEQDLMWLAIAEFTKDDGFIQRRVSAISYTRNGEFATHREEYTVPDGVAYISVMARSFHWMTADAPAGAEDYSLSGIVSLCTQPETDLPVAPLVRYDTQTLTDSQKVQARKNIGAPSLADVESLASAQYENPNVKAVNHRGYNTVAPENTLSAFRLSRKMGFQYAECDVAFTSDGVAVLLHDTTVDRTSNGTGNIADMTFDEVRALDFGSWKSADYAGEQIPFLEEFLILCKQIGLHPYIEVKSETVPEANIADIVAAVNRCGMKNKVTYISFSPWYLTKIKELDDTARLGLVVNDVTQTTITQATSLKTDKNEVFIDAGYWSVTGDTADLCAANGIPLEVWTINGSAALVALDPYVSGYTSDNLRANVTLYDDSGM